MRLNLIYLQRIKHLMIKRLFHTSEWKSSLKLAVTSMSGSKKYLRPPSKCFHMQNYTCMVHGLIIWTMTPVTWTFMLIWVKKIMSRARNIMLLVWQIFTDEGYHKLASKARMSAKMVVLEKTLRKFSKFWTNVKCSYRSYLYPLVKADNKLYAVKCTFSFANGSFVEGSKRLSEYIAVLPMSKIWKWVYLHSASLNILCSICSSWFRRVFEEMASKLWGIPL